MTILIALLMDREKVTTQVSRRCALIGPGASVGFRRSDCSIYAGSYSLMLQELTGIGLIFQGMQLADLLRA
jgi:hypothetical protein